MEARIRNCLAQRFDDDVARHSQLTCLGGHASLRIYWRIQLPQSLQPPRVYPRGETTIMAMVMPLDSDMFKSDEGTSSSAQSPNELPFLNVQRYLADIGMPVPAIDAVFMEQGVLLLEDLGDEMFENAVLAAWQTPHVEYLYQQAIQLLIKFQKSTLASLDTDGRVNARDCIAWQRQFDRDLLLWELEHYVEWGIEARLGVQIKGDERAQFTTAFNQIVKTLVDAPQILVLRDYQSRNIMCKKDTWIMIDFQDALVGPCVYDLVALLRDSYIELEPSEVESLLDYYIEQGQIQELPWCHDHAYIRMLFYTQVLQRKLKDAGRFVFIDRVKNNPDFLKYYEPSIGYVRHALGHLPELSYLNELIR